jgi:hypothetical protein
MLIFLTVAEMQWLWYIAPDPAKGNKGNKD